MNTNPRPTRLSYSSIALHERCPAAWWWRYVVGLTEPSGAAAQRGSRLHTAAEKYLVGQLTEQQLPVEFWKVRPAMVMMKHMGALPETTLLLTEDWQVAGPGLVPAWKMILDIRYWLNKTTLRVVDIKSGRAYESHAEQLQLYATALLSAEPFAEAVDVAGLYLDTGQFLYETTYRRDVLPDLQRVWAERRAAVLADTAYRPHPSFSNCRFCGFAASKGGPCENEYKGDAE